MGKIFCIGDIHGGYKGLLQVLKRSKFDKNNDVLISLGDLCDGWSETPEVIEKLMTIKNLIHVKGNHDEWLINHLLFEDNFTYESAYHLWIQQGGVSTIKAYIRRPELRSKHSDFLLKSKRYYVDDNNNLFVHAGINLATAVDSDLQKAYNTYSTDRNMWRSAYAGINSSNVYNHIYIGHSPTINFPQEDDSQFKPMTRFNITNIDTGAGYGKKLSMINLETKELFQSDNLSELYPNEKGR